MKVLVYATELHVALAIERMLSRKGGEVRTVKQDEELGAVFSEFEPSHVIAGSQAAYDEAEALIQEKNSDAKLALFR